MLTKINELNKNIVVLLSVVIIAITAIAITLIIVSSRTTKGSPGSITDFQEYFFKEYGVKPDITIDVKTNSETQAKEIAKSASKKLGLGETNSMDFDDSNWYYADNDTKKISVTAHYK